MKSTLAGVLLVLGPSVWVSCGESSGADVEPNGVEAADSPTNGEVTTDLGGGGVSVPSAGAAATGAPAVSGQAPGGGGVMTGVQPGTGGATEVVNMPASGETVPSAGTAGEVGSSSDAPSTDSPPAGAGEPAVDDPTADAAEPSDPAGSGSEDSSTGEPDADEVAVDEDPTDDMGNDEAGTDDAATSDETDEPNEGEDTGSEEANNCVLPPPNPQVVGYGQATTGGGNATPVVVSSFAEAEAALANYQDAFDEGTQNALVIRYTGSFDFSTISDVCRQHTLDSQVLQIKEMENVTFEGAPGSSANFGIKINRAKNVIVRNMTMGLLPGGGDSDAITIEGNGTNGDVEHVWIDHNELFSSTKDDCDGAGDTEFDGLIDIKKGARYITISYNHIHDHQKTGLLGHSDSDDVERYVTFHHNWYENVVSRTPLHRFGYVHIFNNYYNQILSSGINVRMGGVALIEANYFENAVNPITSRYSDEVGYWDLRDNHVGEGISWTTESDTLANADDWQSTTTFPSNELNYSYQPDEARCVKQIVTTLAGAKLTL